MKKNSRSENHQKAPICAEFVRQMREVFGDVKVLWIREGDFELGEPTEDRNEQR